MTTEERHYIQRLFAESIPAIAREVVAELKRVESITLDAQYAASMDLDELKRRNHQKLMESRPKRRASK